MILAIKTQANDTERAMRSIQRAVLKTDTVTKYRKNTQKFIKRSMPESVKPYVSAVGVLAISAARGRVETRRIKNLDVKVLNGSIAPNLEYNFRDSNINANIFYRMDF